MHHSAESARPARRDPGTDARAGGACGSAPPCPWLRGPAPRTLSVFARRRSLSHPGYLFFLLDIAPNSWIDRDRKPFCARSGPRPKRQFLKNAVVIGAFAIFILPAELLITCSSFNQKRAAPCQRRRTCPVLLPEKTHTEGLPEGIPMGSRKPYGARELLNRASYCDRTDQPGRASISRIAARALSASATLRSGSGSARSTRSRPACSGAPRGTCRDPRNPPAGGTAVFLHRTDRAAPSCRGARIDPRRPPPPRDAG